MENLNEITARNLEKLEQMKHRRQLGLYAEQKQEKRRRNALVFKVGEMVLACWPWVAQLKVHRTKEENEAEFAALRGLLLNVATDSDFTTSFDIFQQHKYK